jgi:hypothetical protein
LHKFLVGSKNGQADKKRVGGSCPEGRRVIEIEIEIENAQPARIARDFPYGW